mmetsp:Transcript_30516/g.64232  ORF Transcript_30516/g.64232 Transcript_30516/m.64232 type:complete len:215 (-) Transcript_30516:337-981(-)
MMTERKSAADHLYWARTKSEKAPVEHKKLAPEEAAALEAAAKERSGAAWNKAATWEEKDIAKWAHAILCDELLPQISADFSPTEAQLALLPSSAALPSGAVQCVSRVVAAESVSGDATYVLSRGKQRVVFELKLKMKLEVEVRVDGELKQILTGNLQVPEVGSDDVDDRKMPSPKCKCEQGGFTPLFQASAEACWPSMQQTLRTFVEQAKERWR